MTKIDNPKEYCEQLTKYIKSHKDEITRLKTNLGSVSSSKISSIINSLIPFLTSLNTIRKSAKLEVEELRGKIKEFNANERTITRRVYLRQIVELLMKIDIILRKEYGFAIDDQEEIEKEKQYNYEEKVRENDELKMQIRQLEREVRKLTKQVESERKKKEEYKEEVRELKEEIADLKKNGSMKKKSDDLSLPSSSSSSSEDDKPTEKKEMKPKNTSSSKELEELTNNYNQMKTEVSRSLKTLYKIVDKEKVIEDKVIAIYDHQETMKTYRMLFRDLIDMTRFKIDCSQRMEQLIQKESEYDNYKEAVRKGIQSLERVFTSKLRESKFDTCMMFKIHQLPDKFQEIEQKIRALQQDLKRSTETRVEPEKKSFMGTPRKRGGKK